MVVAPTIKRVRLGILPLASERWHPMSDRGFGRTRYVPRCVKTWTLLVTLDMEQCFTQFIREQFEK